jgi:hypothetical protein
MISMLRIDIGRMEERCDADDNEPNCSPRRTAAQAHLTVCA